MNIYIIGIKGTGLSSISLILKDLGNDIRGCDTPNFIFTEKKLIENNIPIDDINNFVIKNADVVIIGNHFWEKFSYLKNNFKVITYQESIKQLINKHHSISICGTHGKTTTSWMLSNCFDNATYLIGDGHGKGVKDSRYFIFESCEYLDNFLNYYPDSIILTNVDYDHVDYFKSKQQYNESFKKYLSHAKKYVFISDQVKETILSNIKCQKLTYGLKSNCDLYAYNLSFSEQGISFNLKYQNKIYENIMLPIYGIHIFYDALATILCSLTYDIPFNKIINVLKKYQPANRRLNISNISNNNVIVDDYGHHPLEIKLTLDSIKQKYPNKDIVSVFHPDRFSRVKTFFDDYINIFKDLNESYILPFLNNSENEQQLIKEFEDKNIKLLTNQLDNKNYVNTVFFFTGSKDMSKWINNLKEKYTK